MCTHSSWPPHGVEFVRPCPPVLCTEAPRRARTGGGGRALFDERWRPRSTWAWDPRRGGQAVRCAATLPHGMGRAVIVGVFAADAYVAAMARAAGAARCSHAPPLLCQPTPPKFSALVREPQVSTPCRTVSCVAPRGAWKEPPPCRPARLQRSCPCLPEQACRS